ncbi:hypothetical protein [Aedoeadaptatus pacaensis]|uniref:hypothetical protein n=1 Tax=Aedoeadaptatus pacaensis TaxID=1776390 RepID=UPI000838BCC4|nr:hypothetical protein [Peptoniphilus pacaensis]
MRKKVLIALGILFAAGVAFAAFLSYAFSPTPDFRRNETVDGMRMDAVVAWDERKPIIRTFKEKDYLALTDNQLAKVRDTIDGKIEGDIPYLSLNKDPKIFFQFEKDEKPVKPEKASIKIIAHASHYDDPQKTRVITGEPKDEGDLGYSYTTKRYSRQYEKDFLEYLQVEVHYTVDGENYISTFGAFQGNVEDGTDFFENETLNTPVEPE